MSAFLLGWNDLETEFISQRFHLLSQFDIIGCHYYPEPHPYDPGAADTG